MKVSWLVAAEGDVRGMSAVFDAALAELGVGRAEVRLPWFNRGAPEAAWMRDGTALDLDALREIAHRLMFGPEAPFGCTLQIDAGLYFQVREWGFDIVGRTPDRLPMTRLASQTHDVEMFEEDRSLDDLGLALPGYRSTTDGLGEELRRCVVESREPLLIEVWASSPGGPGMRAVMPTSVESANEAVQGLEPRSLVIVLDSSSAKRFTTMDEDTFNLLDMSPESADVHWGVIVILPAEAGIVREARCGVWPDILDGFHERIPELLFIPASRWYSEPRPLKFGVPDLDGVVRSLFEWGS